MIQFKKSATALLALTMLVGCGGGNGGTSTGGSTGSESGSDTPLVVGYSPFNSKFSPFFATTGYDQDAQAMTQVSLLNSDRQGAIVFNGIEGETREYNGTDYTYKGISDCTVTENTDGTVDYNFKLRDDLVFSDGEKLTADDVIFSIYVLADPTYDGSSSLFSVPIEGLEEYRQNMSTLAAVIGEAGKDNTDFSVFSEDDAKAFWAAVEDGGVKFAQEIIDYCVEQGAASEGDVAGAAAAWGFEGLAADATAEDFFIAIGTKYDWNFASMEAETAGSALSDLIPEEVYNMSTEGVSLGESAPNISGVTKVNDYEVNIRTTKVDATAIYQLAVTVAPLHYYGELDKYDYENNKFGFDKGDLSHVRSVTTKPLGAGPYKFIKFENGVINFEANEHYYAGCPKTKYMNFIESQESDKLNGIITGTVDITDPSLSAETAKAIEEANGGQLSGDKICTATVDNLGYGYIGIAADVVNVGGDIDSEASKNLRKAFATIYAVYRDVAIDSYYGERASVINYPISNTSWAAPQPTDADYKVAFSTDVNGNEIYTSDMTAEDKYAAAKQAALGYFEAAGYTVSDGKITAAPEGAKMEYEVYIPADGTGDHPSFMILTLAKEAMADIGMNLIVRDLSNSTELWDGLDARTVAMWAAAWGATVDPDMYQIYYSDIANGGKNPGGSNYEYHIQDAELDQLILDGRASTDQSYRKSVYKACLDIIVDWAVEVPVYQRQNCEIFSAERIDLSSITQDITTFYDWKNEVQNIVLK